MWWACHGVPPCEALGEHRPGELHEQQDRDPHERDGERRLGDQQGDPPGLGHQERRGVLVAGRAARRVLPCGAQPLEDQRQAHDDVAGHHDPVVDRVAVVQGREHVRQAEREDQHAQHLDHRGEPEDPVVGVVGRGEPGEVDPCPRDAERGEGEPEQRRPDVPLGQEMGQLVRGRAERDDEGQVEEELERGRGAVVLGRVAAAHPDPAMAAVLDHCGSLGRTPTGRTPLPGPSVRASVVRSSTRRRSAAFMASKPARVPVSSDRRSGRTSTPPNVSLWTRWVPAGVAVSSKRCRPSKIPGTPRCPSHSRAGPGIRR